MGKQRYQYPLAYLMISDADFHFLMSLLCDEQGH